MSTSTFTPGDLSTIQQRGSNLDTVLEQIKRFKEGFDYTNIARACTIGDGISAFTPSQIDAYIDLYESTLPALKVVKFVPASGAASRMFKHLFSAKTQWHQMDKNTGEGKLAAEFIDRLGNFAFSADLKAAAKAAGTTVDQLVENDVPTLLSLVLDQQGLNYGNLPKALIKFHVDEDRPKASIEEHFVEAAGYAADKSNIARIHFTVSPEHLALVQNQCKAIKPHYESKYGVKYEVSYSTQKSSTDTIAVDLQNEPFREADGTILFRPAGHGALIENLNDIEADIVFLKNIDNVLPDGRKADTIRYKKVIGGVLIELVNLINEAREALENGQFSLQEARTFCVEKLGIDPGNSANKEHILSIFNRPVRVCGMVKNEGEPGGGPFWVKQKNGTTSLQIVESAQIDLTNETQASIMSESTHFNPVDVVCSVKQANGQPYNLTDFVDYDAGFVTEKSKDGQSLKAQELPGLWNGSMAKWNTVFVEVPASTFSPVKTVNDLLKEVHQS